MASAGSIVEGSCSILSLYMAAIALNNSPELAHSNFQLAGFG